MSAETAEIQGNDDVFAASRDALQTALGDFNPSDLEPSAQPEPGPGDAVPEKESAEATPAKEDLTVVQPEKAAVPETPTTAAPVVPPQQPPKVAPEVRVAPREPIRITPELMEKTAKRLIDEREDFRKEAIDIESYRAELAQCIKDRDKLAAEVPKIEESIRDESVLLSHYQKLLGENPDALDIKENVAEYRRSILEKKNELSLVRFSLMELKNHAAEMESVHARRVQVLRDEITKDIQQADEKERVESERGALMEQEKSSWESAFETYVSEAKIPDSVKPKVQRYLASHAAANVEQFDGGLSYLDYMRKTGQDVLDILAMGREAGAREYQESKRKDVTQQAPALKPGQSASEPEKQLTMDEIQSRARASLKEKLGAA